MRKVLTTVAIVALAGVLALAAGAEATILTVSDLNSSIKVDDSSPGGMFQWTVDGVDQIVQQSFWFRLGAAGEETNISALTLSSSGALGRNIDVVYSNGAGFSMDVL